MRYVSQAASKEPHREKVAIRVAWEDSLQYDYGQTCIHKRLPGNESAKEKQENKNLLKKSIFLDL